MKCKKGFFHLTVRTISRNHSTHKGLSMYNNEPSSVMEKGTLAATTIDLKRDDAEDLTGCVHQLPCCVKSTGPASVSHYFKPKPTGIEVEGLALEEAYFRGRKLDGTTINLPHGYSVAAGLSRTSQPHFIEIFDLLLGFLLGKKSLNGKISSDISEDNSNSWEMRATFQSFTYWNHDCLPSQNDEFLRAFHWLSVAKALHNPVTPEDLASTPFSI